MKKGRKPKGKKGTQKSATEKPRGSFFTGEIPASYDLSEDFLSIGRRSIYQIQNSSFVADSETSFVDLRSDGRLKEENLRKGSDRQVVDFSSGMQNGGPITRRKEHQMQQSNSKGGYERSAMQLNTLKKFDEFYKEKKNVENEMYLYHPPRVSWSLYQIATDNIDTNNFNTKNNYVERNSAKPGKVFDHSRISEEDLNYYLKFVNYYKESSSAAVSGSPFLKGLHSFEAKALSLLKEVDYDIGLAFQTILFPVMHLLNGGCVSEASPEHSMTYVNSALNDLIGSNIQEKEAWLDHVKSRIEECIRLEELREILDLGAKMKIDVPDFVQREIELSLGFSKTVRRHLNEKNSIIEINNLLQQCAPFKVRTEDFFQLEEVLKKAQLWISRVSEMDAKPVNYKTLQGLYQEYKKLPVSLPNFDKIKSTYFKAKKWQEEYARIPKHSKTRGVGNSAVKKAKDERCTTAYLQKMATQSDEINFTSNDVAFLKSNFDKLRETEARIRMSLEDEHVTKTRDLLNDFANSLDSLKFTTELYDVVVYKLDYLSWEDQKNYYMHTKVLKMKHLRSLIKEASLKNLQNFPEIKSFKKTFEDIENWMDGMSSIFYFNENGEEDSDFREEIKETKKFEEKKKVAYNELVNLYHQGKQFDIEPEEVEHLLMKCDEFFEFLHECSLACVKFAGGSSDPAHKCDYSEMTSLKRRMAKYNVECEEFETIENHIGLVYVWLRQYDHFMMDYMNLDFDFKFLFLPIDSLDRRQESVEMLEVYRRRNSIFCESLLEVILKTPHVAKFNDEYEELLRIKSQAESHMNTTSFVQGEEKATRDRFVYFPHEMDLEELQQFINMSHKLSISRDFFDSLLCIYRAKSWVQMSQMKQKMSLHEAEQLIKEAATINFRSKEIEEMRDNISRTKEWVKLSKKVVSRKDKTKYEDLKCFINEGIELPLDTSELQYLLNFQTVFEKEINEVRAFLQTEHSFEEMKEYYFSLTEYPIDNIPEFDVISTLTRVSQEWKYIANKILSSRQLCELYFKVDSEARRMDYSDDHSHKVSTPADSGKKLHESQMVTCLDGDHEDLSSTSNVHSKKKQKKGHKQDRSASKPKKKSSKAPSSTNSAHNDSYLNISAEMKLIMKKTENFPHYDKCAYLAHFLVLREDLPEDKYCICRRGDDGINYMLMCESCKEWFHGGCLKISQFNADKISQYLCVGCSRRKDFLSQSYNIDFLNYKRISLNKFGDFLLEGIELPIILDEVNILKFIWEKIHLWILNYESAVKDITDFLHQNTDPSKIFGEDIEKTLLNLYHESEGFPVELDQATNIIIILKHADWFRNASRCLDNKKMSEKSSKKLLCASYSIFNKDFIVFTSEIERLYFNFACVRCISVVTEIVKNFDKVSSLYFEFKGKYDRKFLDVVEDLLSPYEAENFQGDKNEVKTKITKEVDKFIDWYEDLSFALLNQSGLERKLPELYQKAETFTFKCAFLDKFKKVVAIPHRDHVDYLRSAVEEFKKKDKYKKDAATFSQSDKTSILN